MQMMNARAANGRTRTLMAGVSALALVMAMGVAMPGEAQAQLELNGAETNPVDIGDGAIVVNEVVGGAGDFGAINTNDGATNPASVSLANDGTITVTDSAGGDAETGTVAGSFVINAGMSGTLIFMQADTGAAAVDGNAAGFAITGDLDGGDGLPGGNLLVTARDGVDQDESGFSVAGDTHLDKVTVQAGNSGVADGGDLSATFGDESSVDSFTTTGAFAVQGGTSAEDFAGGDATATVNAATATVGGLTLVQAANGGNGIIADTGEDGGASTLILNIGDTGTLQAIEVNGGDGGTGATDDPIGPGGNGGTASLTLNGGTVTATTLTIAAGDGGNGGDDNGFQGSDGGIGGSATATIETGTSLTLNGDGGAGVGLAVNAGTTGIDGAGTGFDPGLGGNGGKATLSLAGALSVLDDIGIDGGRISITNGGSLEVTGDVNGVSGVVELAAGSSFAFTNDGVNQTVTDTSFDGGGTLRFTGDDQTVTFDTAIGESERLGALEFSDGADATFQDMVDVIGMTIGENSEAIFETESSISGSVTGDGLIRFDAAMGDVLTFGIPVALGGTQTEAHTIATDVLIGTPNQGIIQINNTGGLTFEGVLGGKSRAEGVQIAENSVVVFNNTVTTDDFTVQGAGTNLTFNADSASQVIIGDGGMGALTLNDGTITLGNAVGDGDTVFDIEAGDNTNLPVNHAAAGGIALNLDAGFTEGSIALIDTNGLDFTAGGAADALIAAFDVNDTVLADFTLGARTGAADILEVTAQARNTGDVAGALGVDEQDASALQAFVGSNDPNDPGLNDATTELLSTGTIEQQRTAAETVGTSGSVLVATITTVESEYDAVTSLLDVTAPVPVAPVSPPVDTPTVVPVSEFSDPRLHDFFLTADGGAFLESELGQKFLQSEPGLAYMAWLSERVLRFIYRDRAPGEGVYSDLTLLPTLPEAVRRTEAYQEIHGEQVSDFVRHRIRSRRAQRRGEEPPAAVERSVDVERLLESSVELSASERNRILSQVNETLSEQASEEQSTGINGGDALRASPAADGSPLSLWMEGFGGLAGADGSAGSGGYDSRFGGFVIGLEGELADGFTLGAFTSYSLSRVQGDGAANASTDAMTYGVGLYANYRWDNFYLSGTARYAFINNDLSRTATIGVLTRTVTADYDARQLGLSLSGGVRIEVAPDVIVTPHANLSWSHYDADSYTEVGTGVTQTVDPESVSTLNGTIGARISRAYANFDGAGTTFTPELSLAVRGELMGDDAVSTVAFTGGGSSYQVTGTGSSTVGALLGLGATFENAGWSASLSYGAELRSDFQSHTGSARFSWSF